MLYIEELKALSILRLSRFFRQPGLDLAPGAFSLIQSARFATLVYTTGSRQQAVWSGLSIRHLPKTPADMYLQGILHVEYVAVQWSSYAKVDIFNTPHLCCSFPLKEGTATISEVPSSPLQGVILPFLGGHDGDDCSNLKNFLQHSESHCPYRIPLVEVGVKEHTLFLKY